MLMASIKIPIRISKFIFIIFSTNVHVSVFSFIKSRYTYNTLTYICCLQNKSFNSFKTNKLFRILKHYCNLQMCGVFTRSHSGYVKAIVSFS